MSSKAQGVLCDLSLVTPAKAGVQERAVVGRDLRGLDSRFRGYDKQLRGGLLVAVLSSTLLCFSASARAEDSCLGAEHLPLITIDNPADLAMPVIDEWQIMWRDTPLSDSQLAQLAGDQQLEKRNRGEMASRGKWTFFGLGTAAGGTAVSSVGWVLLGQNKVSRGVTLPLAIGGILVGLAGVLVVSESVQRPMEPFMAPTPRHRMTREQARRLVVRANERLRSDVCNAVAQEAAP